MWLLLLMKILVFLTLFSCTTLFARTWTDKQGRVIEADLVRSDAKSVVVNFKGKEVSIARENLSDADLKFVADSGSVPSSSPTGALTLWGKVIQKGGQTNVLEKDYGPESLKQIQKTHLAIGTGDSSSDSKKV